MKRELPTLLPCSPGSKLADLSSEISQTGRELRLLPPEALLSPHSCLDEVTEFLSQQLEVKLKKQLLPEQSFRIYPEV